MKDSMYLANANGVNGTAIEHFDAAVRAFNIYRGDPVALADQAIEAAPDFAMAHILKAYLFGLATEPEATAEAKAILETVTPSCEDRKRDVPHRGIGGPVGQQLDRRRGSA